MSSENTSSAPLVAVIMGSKSDWETMRHADETLTEFGVAHECRVMSAHRTPQLASEFSSTASSRGVEVIIAAAGGAAHLAGVIAAHTTLAGVGCADEERRTQRHGFPAGHCADAGRYPRWHSAIGKPGAINAALFAVAILANSRPELRTKLEEFRERQEEQVRSASVP